jgi:hypothetical protein
MWQASKQCEPVAGSSPKLVKRNPAVYVGATRRFENAVNVRLIGIRNVDLEVVTGVGPGGRGCCTCTLVTIV